MTLHPKFRLCALALTIAIGGCSSLESIEAALSDAPFVAKPAVAPATAPEFRAGDVYRFKVGENLISEKVEMINAEGVWWRDSLGRRWVGSASALVPSRAVVDTDGSPKITNAVLESTGDLFPLAPGKSVAYRYTTKNGFHAANTHERSCAVQAFGAVKTAAGVFDAVKLKCYYDGIARNNYYAPALGRVVLQTSDTIFDSVKRELVGFERGPAEPLRTAEHKPMAPAGIAPAGKPVAAPAGKPAMAPMMAKGSGAGRYGVQLAAYRSPTRAKQAWGRLQRRGNGLLDGQQPVIERHNGRNGPLFRLVVGSYDTKNKARAYCRTLKRSGIDCWPRARMAANRSSVVGMAPTPTDLRVVRR